MENAIATHPEVQAAIRLWEAWVESKAAYRGQPGISLGVVYDQELIWSRGVGMADIDSAQPATSQTVYRIASITKLFTATALVQLRDAGKLELDDPISRYLLWFGMKQPDDSRPITIRHLLTHTSGLPREAPFPYWNDVQFPTREAMIESLTDHTAVFPVEQQWKYSNLALALAGEVVAAVSEQPYVEYIQQHILDPLSMASTTLTLIDEKHERLATAYGRQMPDGTRALRPFADCKGITPAANMASTVEDLARFASLQFRDGPVGGAQILKGSSLREMQRVHWLDPDWKSGWGLGFKIRRMHDRTLVEHGGALPGYRTNLSICPQDKIAFIVLTNADDGEPQMYVDQAYAMIAPAMRKAAAQQPEPFTAPPEWQRYVGTYRNPWDDIKVFISHEGLALVSLTAPDPLASLMQLHPENEHTFRLSGRYGNSSIGELAVFEMDEGGKVVRLKVGDWYTERV